MSFAKDIIAVPFIGLYAGFLIWIPCAITLGFALARIPSRTQMDGRRETLRLCWLLLIGLVTTIVGAAFSRSYDSHDPDRWNKPWFMQVTSLATLTHVVVGGCLVIAARKARFSALLMMVGLFGVTWITAVGAEIVIGFFMEP
jgi:hypothetical protein